MSKLEKAKQVIEHYYEDATGGIFDSRNIVGDLMDNIYEDDGLSIDICYGYAYFEVFGLTDEEFEELADFYESLQRD